MAKSNYKYNIVGRKAIMLNGYKKSEHPFLSLWANMKDRCKNPNATSWHYYGARGIVVCEEWEKFEVFVKDMWPRPEGTTLDRKNNNLGYSKENCKWSTKKEQQNNRRKTSSRDMTSYRKKHAKDYR